MCLALPARIESINDERIATVDLLGVRREVALDLVPHAREGNFVLVHAGYGIEVVSEDDAHETLDLLSEFPDLLAEG
ncbi:MAG: HypC/HybG/HupF family hydrogenase formation chaperone [Coriobacteriales bacterium]|jgi:hydrogenase expression/formation protein HypC|nr:HypC/HybG/HupF family hydrogenase formation chaperone [Coriobacteriales bacterium]